MSRETLNRHLIVTTAIELLDTHGLEGFNIRALGKRLGGAATAIYWHVGSKDNLVALAVEQAWNEIALPDVTELGWRKAAANMANELRAMLRRHLWLVQAFGTQVLYGRGKARHDNHCLAIYETAGLDKTQAMQAATAVMLFVLGSALGPAASASLTRKLDRETGNARDALRESLETAHMIAAEYPRLRAYLEPGGEAYALVPDGSFNFGLEAILDGLQIRLEQTGPQSGNDRR